MKTEEMPLTGIRVIELSTVVAAPTTSRMLCAYGAEVIKIESAAGDQMRRVGKGRKAPCEDYKNPMFDVHNSNKRLVSLNIKSEEGRKLLLRLMKKADVFITNVREASLVRLGLDYDSLKEIFPRLVYAQFYGYGPKGPAANDPGYDSTAFWMRSGPLADWTVKGEHPFYPTYGFGDVATSSVLLAGILMALYARGRTGKGTMVNTSLFASGVWCNATGVVSTQFVKKHLNPDYLHPLDPFDTFYECKDGNWIAIYTNGYVVDREKFAKNLDMMDILEDPRWDTQESLEENDFMREAVLRVASIFKTKNASEWREKLSAASISCEIMCRTCNVSKDMQAIENHYVEEVRYPDGLSVMLPCPPIHFSDYIRKPYVPTGRIGEDTTAVLKEFGYAEDAIKALRENGAIK